MKTAIITGASSGLGTEYFRATAERYGDIEQFWIIARRKERLQKLAGEYDNKNIRILELDLAKADTYTAFSALLDNEKPDIRLLINCAGLGNFSRIAESDVRTETNMVDVNIKGVVAMTTMCLKYMNRGAKILNVASIAGFAPTPSMTVYSCTKSFVLDYSRALRVELREKGISVLAVCPGPMKTEFLQVASVNGKSKKFDAMPVCDQKNVARVSLEKLDKGRGVYTPRFLLKLYRVAAHIIPCAIFVKLSDLQNK